MNPQHLYNKGGFILVIAECQILWRTRPYKLTVSHSSENQRSPILYIFSHFISQSYQTIPIRTQFGYKIRTNKIVLTGLLLIILNQLNAGVPLNLLSLSFLAYISLPFPQHYHRQIVGFLAYLLGPVLTL